jgi:hypothetical protein
MNDTREKIDNSIFKKAFNKVFKSLNTFYTAQELDEI